MTCAWDHPASFFGRGPNDITQGQADSWGHLQGTLIEISASGFATWQSNHF